MQSLLAVWLTWLLPTSVVGAPLPSEFARAKQPTRPPRRTAEVSIATGTSRLSKRIRHAVAPIDLTPILATRAIDPQTARRVHYADASPSPTAAVQNTTAEIPIDVNPTAILQVENSGSQTSVVSPEKASDTAGPLDNETVESDSSHTSSCNSRKRSHCLPKLKLRFHKRRSESLDRADQSSVASTGLLSNAHVPSSIIDIPLFSDIRLETDGSRRESGSALFMNNRKAPDMNAVYPPKESPSFLSFRRRSSSATRNPTTSLAKYSPSTTDLLSPTFFVRKSQNRTSVPIPRTMPYGPPYFATPPVLLDRQSHLKSLPQFQDEMITDLRTADSDSELLQGQITRRVSLTAAPPRSPKIRSFSADFAKMNR